MVTVLSAQSGLAGLFSKEDLWLNLKKHGREDLSQHQREGANRTQSRRSRATPVVLGSNSISRVRASLSRPHRPRRSLWRTADYPRMLFHRSREPVTVQSRDEEDALGQEWSRTIWTAASKAARARTGSRTGTGT